MYLRVKNIPQSRLNVTEHEKKNAVFEEKSF
jgi:hypothetical protein